MLKREEIIQELWKRLHGTSGIVFTARNPDKPPAVDNLPCAQFFEMEDEVEDTTMRGDFPLYKRALTVVVEVFVKGTTPELSTQQLMTQLKLVKAAIYLGGASLGRRCSIVETAASRVLRPPVGENVAGIGIVFKVRYVEDSSNA